MIVGIVTGIWKSGASSATAVAARQWNTAIRFDGMCLWKGHSDHPTWPTVKLAKWRNSLWVGLREGLEGILNPISHNFKHVKVRQLHWIVLVCSCRVISDCSILFCCVVAQVLYKRPFVMLQVKQTHWDVDVATYQTSSNSSNILVLDTSNIFKLLVCKLPDL